MVSIESTITAINDAWYTVGLTVIYTYTDMIATT